MPKRHETGPGPVQHSRAARPQPSSAQNREVRRVLWPRSPAPATAPRELAAQPCSPPLLQCMPTRPPRGAQRGAQAGRWPLHDDRHAHLRTNAHSGHKRNCHNRHCARPCSRPKRGNRRHCSCPKRARKQSGSTERSSRPSRCHPPGRPGSPTPGATHRRAGEKGPPPPKQSPKRPEKTQQHKGETAATTAAVRRTAQRGATAAAAAEKDRATKLCRMMLAANPGDPGLLLPLLSGRHHRRPGPSHKHCALHCT